MKRKGNIETGEFDRALFDAFRQDPECGAFGTFDDLSHRRMINDIVVAASGADPTPITDKRNNRRGRRTMAVAVAALIVGVCIVGSFLKPSQKPAEQPLRETYFGEVQDHDGDLYFGGKSVSLNAPVPVGQSIRTENSTALLRLLTGIEWWLAQRGHAQIASLDSKHLEIEVLSGESWFRVDPKREGPSFTVDTKMGRIDVNGTVFVVTAEPSDVRVTLIKGEVRVTRRPSGQSVVVRAGYTLSLRNGDQYALSPDEQQRMTTRLSKLTWNAGTAPVAMDTTLKPHDDTDANPKPIAKPTAAPTREAVAKASPRHLLEEIRALRKRREWKRVATLYNRLIQSTAGSETAIVSRVSLGEIYLTKLHLYEKGLVHFEKYLHSGHTTLLPEALYGKCNALKALGKRRQEEVCLNRFILRFTDAFQAPDARVRLDALHGKERI
jgi:hypothetical protein